MARFVMSNRRASKFTKSEKLRSRDAVETAFALNLASSVRILGENSPPQETARKIMLFEGDPKEIAAKSQDLSPDVIIEPEILHYPVQSTMLTSMWFPFISGAEDLSTDGDATLSMTVKGLKKPLAGAEVILVLRGALGRSRRQSAVTTPAGKVVFRYDPFWSPTAAIVIPVGEYWPVIVRGPQHGGVVSLPPLPREGPLAWWHRHAGADTWVPGRGQGIRVGVIDTGVGPHPDLVHVQAVGAFLNGGHDPTGGADVDSHGSHVCGTIAGRPADQSSGYGGMAAGVEIFSARVFPSSQAGANQGDIANAIDFLSREQRVDLINMSLGAAAGSEIERDAIIDALERGTLCVCAAGNSAGPVEWPAAFDECVAVAAIGLEGWGPDGSISGTRYPSEKEKYGREALFLSNFSCFGAEIDCCAPGVGIIAAVPERHGWRSPYAAMDGTSMASPVACGSLAAILSADGSYSGLQRDVTRAERARELLRASCADVGMSTRFQGMGVPRVR